MNDKYRGSFLPAERRDYWILKCNNVDRIVLEIAHAQIMYSVVCLVIRTQILTTSIHAGQSEGALHLRHVAGECRWPVGLVDWRLDTVSHTDALFPH